MSVPEPLNPKVPTARRLAPRFTPNTPFHHPHLDPTLRAEDLDLVPAALFAGTRPKSERPGPAVTNLHVMLKLSNDSDKVRKEFHDMIPHIDDVLGLWGEMKRTSPTTNGEAQLRARTGAAEVQGWISSEEGKGTTFNLASSLDTPGRADVIYLTDATEDSGERDENSSVPSNLRTIEWLGFDGSYVHLEDSEPKMAAFPMEQGSDADYHGLRRNSTPSNLRLTEWLEDQQSTDPPSETYSGEPYSNSGKPLPEIGPYEKFWINHNPSGP